MSKQLELWQFIDERLVNGQPVMLLIVAESHGSSPGRQGYKMAVGADGELIGSIGGGVMEVNLAEQSQILIKDRLAQSALPDSLVVDQVHRSNNPNASGMICSGEQTVILKLLHQGDTAVVGRIILEMKDLSGMCLAISPHEINVFSADELTPDQGAEDLKIKFERRSNDDFLYTERLGKTNELIIVGGGHCALALSEIMSRMDFHIRILDDRPELNTLSKNKFADEITIIDDYERIAEYVTGGDNVYVAVMTLGYVSDAVVIRQLIGKPLKYFGVLGSKVKMATLLKQLSAEGFSPDLIKSIKTPIGLPIASQTPEEIAVSICAEIISVKNTVR